KIGSVTLVLGKDVIVEIPDEVRQVIRTLTPDELDDLLAVQGSGTFTAESLESPQVETWRRWVSLGLLTEMSQSELETYRKTSLENKNAVVGFRSTPLLYSARKSLIDLLPQILRKAERKAVRR